MSREKKLRALNRATGEWYYGCQIPFEDESNPYEISLSRFWLKIEEGILDISTKGDFTGLRNKNGKEIYHKDKVEITFPTGEKVTGLVVWDFLSWQIEGGGMLSNFDEDSLEVVGYENPELIEK